MSLNPITYTERVVGDFLRYQVTAYPFADERLLRQMRDLLSLSETRRTPLLKGPYISLSRPFRAGAKIADLVADGSLHPFMENVAPFPALWGHQERAIRAIVSGRTTLMSTGTGSGKTECFLYPAISQCLRLRDENASAGIVAVFVYPMNALAEDQLGRLRSLLAGTGIPFGMYVGKTPERTADVTGERLRPGASKADYEAAFRRAREEKRGTSVDPPEERVSREQMRTAGEQPRILLTNVKQLELLLTRQVDASLFAGANLRFIVFDEAHTYGGADGAETACLIRRLRAYCDKEAADTVCIGTSATLVDELGSGESAKDFAGRFFGVNADNVELVTEEFEEETWPSDRATPSEPAGSSVEHLDQILEALDSAPEDATTLRGAVEGFAGLSIDTSSWQEDLYEALSHNELCYQLARELRDPVPLRVLADRVSEGMGRPVSEAETLTWLALGVAARRGDRPLMRSVVHGFVSGVGSAVVSFPEDQDGPRLWLSGREEAAAEGEDGLFDLEVATCTTCGQHYFIHYLADLHFGASGLEGGDAVGERRVWRSLEAAEGGVRLILLDQLVSAEDDEEESEEPARTLPVFFCRYCGGLHPQMLERCDACGRASPLVRLLAIRRHEKHPGYLTSCLSCRAPGASRGGYYREPARRVRAVSVSDVHVLAQNMVHYADRKRLLVFTDNRQEAAFQAGWMRDHSRRFRLRSLMYDRIRQGPVSVGDLAAHLDRILESDESLSRALVPEVWAVARREDAGTVHAEERRYFLRVLTLREITTGVKQRVGLEPWGRMRMEYLGLVPDLPFVHQWSERIGTTPERLTDGIAALLDVHRRKFFVLDREGQVFSHYWMEGDREIQRGYLPKLPGVPKGLKLQRGATDDHRWVKQWLSERGQTVERKAAVAFGVEKDFVPAFLEELWYLLARELEILVPVTLTGARGNALPNCAGVRQIDSDKLRITPHEGRWRCGRCRRTQVRPMPNDACIAWLCDGTLSFERDDPDDYDLRTLEQGFSMIKPAEHSAQVPGHERERLEQLFKGDSDAVNTLVCTPTLELGVDIGGLDTVLLRNVPPLPANYWQRVGRAGRRHRLAVNLTYARPTSHDRAYFAEPLKLLGGRVEPPRFNLKNEVMLQKHVRATVLTRLHQLAAANSPLSEFDRQEIDDTLEMVFPRRVRDYLFDDDGRLRSEVFDVSPLALLIRKHEPDLIGYVTRTFTRDWPAEDVAVVDAERLRQTVLETASRLEEVIRTLKRRLDWAMNQINRLSRERSERGVLEPDEEQLFHRCDRLVRRLKGQERRGRHEAEGYDETNTFGVLAVEGFLPGYGLEVGAVVATAHMPRHLDGGSDFTLPRAPSTALREYVPGNLIYANGHRFVTRYFHFDVEESRSEPIQLRVDLEKGALSEIGAANEEGIATLSASDLTAVAITDVDLTHVSRITDDEDYRFQLPVAIEGYELERHGEGNRFDWGGRDLIFRRGVHLRLVNLGTAYKVGEGTLGYPMSLVTGQSRSPLASRAELENFEQTQLERTGKPIQWVGFYTDIVADALSIPRCADREEAHSLLEALRVGMNHVLEMDREDLETLVIGYAGSDEADALLYDPMPGGSGLLEQLCDRWGEVIAAALELLEQCESACERSCIDCLQTYRNAYVHRFLNRHRAIGRLREWGSALTFAHSILEKLPQERPRGDEMPVNEAEERLRRLLHAAALPSGKWQQQIQLGRPLGSTTPDVFFAGDDEDDPGVCLYLDGLSRHIHGNEKTQRRDRTIRDELRSRGYFVIEIPASHLADRDEMIRHFRRLARVLEGKEKARALADDSSWFDESPAASVKYPSGDSIRLDAAETPTDEHAGTDDRE